MDTREEGTRRQEQRRGQGLREEGTETQRGEDRDPGGRDKEPERGEQRPRAKDTETQKEIKTGMGKLGDTVFRWGAPRPQLGEPLRHAVPLANPGPAQACGLTLLALWPEPRKSRSPKASVGFSVVCKSLSQTVTTAAPNASSTATDRWTLRGHPHWHKVPLGVGIRRA